MILEHTSELANFKKPQSRLLGFDVGSKTIGLALSDVDWIIASPYKTIERQKFTKDIKEFQKIFDEFKVAGLVLGLPKNMNGSEGPRCQSTRQFAQNFLRHYEMPLCFWDERLSTIAVTRVMLEADISRKRQGEVVDKMAASFILQGLLDSLRYISHYQK